MLRAYADNEHRVEPESYRPYREILARDRRARCRACSAGRWRPNAPASWLRAFPSWQPFPDTNAALERLLAAVCRLGILSNIDNDLLAETREHFTVGFDFVVTAQQVRSYKPGHAHFQTARDLIGPRAGCTRPKATSTTSSRRTPSASTTPGSIASGSSNCPAARRSTSSMIWPGSRTRWRERNASSFGDVVGEFGVRPSR